jgi:hypothetical protein
MASKVVAMFGLIALPVTLIHALAFRLSLLGDDAYIMGWSTAVMIVPAVAFLLAADRLWGRRAGNLTYAAYLFVLVLYLLYSALHSEAGPGLPMVFVVSMAVLAPIAFFCARTEALQRLVVPGWVMAAAFLLAFAGIFLFSGIYRTFT